MAFGNTAKLDEAMFNGKQTDEPVIVGDGAGRIEALASGTPKLHAQRQDVCADRRCGVDSGRPCTFIRRGDGLYAKQTA